MDCLLLLRKVSAGGRGDKIVSICADMDVGLATTDVHPQATKHLASPVTFDQRVKLSHSSRKSRAVDLVGLVLNQRAASVLRLVAWLAQEDGLTSLRAAVRIVFVRSIRKPNNPEITVERPELEISRLKFDGANKLVQCLQVTERRS